MLGPAGRPRGHPGLGLVLQAIYRTPFGIADPVFSRDIGFYVFTLPALSAAHRVPLRPHRSSRLLLLVPVYWLRGDLVAAAPAAQRRAVGGAAPRHPARGAAAPHRPCGSGWWTIPSLLYSTTGPLIGASYTDLHARLPGAARLGGPGRRRPPSPSWSARLRGQLARYALVGGRGLPGRGRHRARPLPAGDAEVRRGADRADPRDALSPVSHRRHPAGLGPRQRGDPRAERRGRPHAGRHPGQRARRSRTCGCGTASRCCRPSGSCRRSAPTTTSSRWTTTGTGSTGSTARSCSRRGSSTPRRCRPGPSSTST